MCRLVHLAAGVSLLSACFSPGGSITDTSTGMTETASTGATMTATEPDPSTPTTMSSLSSTTAEATGSTTDPSTGPTSGVDDTSSTGEPMGMCGNGVAEPNELCLGTPSLQELVVATDIRLADLDGNGSLDLAIGIDFDGEVVVYLGDGNGNFTYGSSEATGPEDIALGLFDGDALADFVYPVDRGVGPRVEVVLNDGAPTIPGSGTPYDVSGAQHVATGDLDNDTYDDIVSVGVANQLTVLRSNAGGSGAFSLGSNQSLLGTPKTNVLVAEFNNNANLDVAVAIAGGSNRVGVCLGNGSGGFGGCSVYDVGPNPSGLAAGDFDGDGNVDLVTSNLDDDTLTVLWGQGNGGFDDDPLTIATGPDPFAAAAGDLDNDGQDDIVTVARDDAHVYVYVAGEARDFTEVVYDQGDVTLVPEDVTLGDINEDGALDIVIANANAQVGSIGFILSEV